MLLGVLVQFLVMPALAAGIAAALHLPAPLAVGLILVGCCPGGTASNVVALIGRGDVALSVVMTTVSTLAAVVLTPRLTQVLASQYVPVDGWASVPGRASGGAAARHRRGGAQARSARRGSAD